MDIIYLKRELTRVIPEILKEEREELRMYNGVYIPTTFTLQPGEEGVTQFGQKYSGRAARYTGISTDIPTVNVSINSHDYRTAQWVIGAEWTQFELLSEQVARANSLINRTSVVQQKMSAMAEIISESMDKALTFGDFNFNGFVNTSDVTLQVESTAPYTLAPLPLYNYFRGVVEEFKRTSGLISSQITMVVPPDLYSKLSTQPLPSEMSASPYRLLTDSTNGQSVAEILELPALDSAMLEANGVQAAGTNRDRFILYHRSPDTLRRETYNFRNTVPAALPDGLHFMCSGYEGSTEMMVRKPYRMRYYSIAQPV